MENVFVPVMAGVLIEALVFYAQIVQKAIKERALDWRIVAALLGGVSFAVVYQQDLFAEYAALVPFVGSVFTGVIYSRLANLTNDIIGKVRS